MAQGERFGYIDALRAIAAGLVVWMHTAEQFVGQAAAAGSGGSWPLTLASPVNFGRIGVSLFFVISGFVIPRSLRGSRAQGLRAFAITRFFRLFPLFWLSIPLGALTETRKPPLSLRDFLLNLTMIPQLLHARPAMGLYWTLWVELIFYALCAALFACGLLGRPRVLLFASCVCAIAFHVNAIPQLFGLTIPIPRTPAAVSKALTVAMPLMPLFGLMFLGSILRRAKDGPSLGRGESLLLRSMVILWIVGVPVADLVAWLCGEARVETASTLAGHGIGVSMFVLGTGSLRIQSSFLAWLGRISYSIYLLHAVVMFSMIAAIARWGLLWVPPIISMVVCAAAAVLLSGITYRLVEQPAIRLGKRLVGETTRRPAAGNRGDTVGSTSPPAPHWM